MMAGWKTVGTLPKSHYMESVDTKGRWEQSKCRRIQSPVALSPAGPGSTKCQTCLRLVEKEVPDANN